MRLGINLRDDLAKLSENELPDQLEARITQRNWLISETKNALNRWAFRLGIAMPFGRGPLHARIFYRLRGRLTVGAVTGHSLGDLYVVECEIKDLMDELRSRIGKQSRLTKSGP
ncbi:hypothetical protein ASE61_11900 [Bosea sp. Root670]|nr:hypothetical protein ASE61_11900 [Bosea sp. Root670]